MLVLGAVLALAQAEAVAPSRSGVRPPEPTVTVCEAIAVTSREAPKRRGSFSATKILDLQLGAILRSRIAGEHVLSLKVYTPKGHLYQQIDVPFHGSAVGATRGRGYQVSARLPVAGTSIMTSSLYGQWKVAPHLDGSPKACGKAVLFTITQ